jgi:hypothetical protein
MTGLNFLQVTVPLRCTRHTSTSIYHTSTIPSYDGICEYVSGYQGPGVRIPDEVVQVPSLLMGPGPGGSEMKTLRVGCRVPGPSWSGRRGPGWHCQLCGSHGRYRGAAAARGVRVTVTSLSGLGSGPARSSLESRSRHSERGPVVPVAWSRPSRSLRRSRVAAAAWAPAGRAVARR